MQVQVGRMGEGPAIAAGPLAAYLAQWPERRVEWSWSRQVWEVRETNPKTGADERVHFVFYYDDAMGDASPETVEELAVRIRANDPTLRKVFRPLDQRFVEMKLLDWQTMETLGPKGFVDRVLANNRKVWEGRARQGADDMASGWAELRNWFPVLSHYHETGRWEADRRIPQIPVGVTLQGG